MKEFKKMRYEDFKSFFIEMFLGVEVPPKHLIHEIQEYIKLYKDSKGTKYKIPYARDIRTWVEKLAEEGIVDTEKLPSNYVRKRLEEGASPSKIAHEMKLYRMPFCQAFPEFVSKDEKVKALSFSIESKIKNKKIETLDSLKEYYHKKKEVLELSDTFEEFLQSLERTHPVVHNLVKRLE